MFKPKTLRQFMLLSAFALVASTKAMVAMDARAQKSLSATDTRGDSYEERMMRPFAAKIASEMERLAPSLRLELSSDKEKMISTFFKESNVESAEGNLFASEQYQLWASRVFDNYKDSAMAYMFRELKKHFDDYKLALLIVEGRASIKTEDVAKEYFNLQMENWVANKKNNLDVFRALKLDNGEGSVFKNPLLETYVSFARRLPREDLPDEQPIFSELFTMLEQKFGVVGVAEMLGAANVDLREGSVGNRVMYALFRDIASKGPKGSLDYVKNVFNDNAVVDSSAVSIWLSYAKWSLDGVDYERLVTGMVDGLWNEREVKVKALATVIAAAQKDASTRDAATNTLIELFVEWRNEQMTTSNVLNILGLKPTKMKAEDMTESPLLETWFAFESRRRTDDADLLEALQSQLTEEQLASMIVIRTANPIIKNRVSSVKAALFNKWRTKFVDQDDAFVRLQLDKSGDKLFTHPALNVWYWYVLQYYGLESEELITRVVKKYFRDPDSLLDMVIRELKRNKYSSANSIARMLSP